MFSRMKNRIRHGSSHVAESGSESETSNRPKTPSKTKKIKKTLGLSISKSPSSSSLSGASQGFKVDELAAFDSCVEACDALAASSHYAQSSGKIDPKTGLQDCSVLVSPDGDLLLLPQDTREISTAGSMVDSENRNSVSSENEVEDPVPPLPRGFSGLADTDEYQSAVIMGNDLQPDSNINGFSAMGWSPSATSLALRQTSESLREMTSFVEMLILSRKETAAKESHACNVLRAAAGISEKTMPWDSAVPPMPIPEYLRSTSSGGSSKSKGNRWRTTSGDRSGFDFDKISELEASPPLIPNEYNRESPTLELSNGRIGPLNYSRGSLHAATVALENYHSTMAENDSNRWRMASLSTSSGVGVLPALRKASDQAAERAYRREKALREMQAKAAAAEKQLQRRKLEAKQRWYTVHEAEEKVTRIVEAQMTERRKERERRRVEKLQEEHEIRLAENTNLGATPGEIWDIVSAVAESMEDGSFAPTGLPQAPISGPVDKSHDEVLDESADPKETRPPSPSMPLASRVDIEQECRLPELRAAAMAADEAIEDTAGTLLNILSTLDTTRRSARVAAETCLLSAAHSQVACIRSLVALERASIEDRLQNIAALERSVDTIDVRSDLNAYINADKDERGGSTWLGDDDDGGVASALAILSSHVDGNMGHGSPAKISLDGWDGLRDDEITPERLEDAIEDLFEPNELLLETAKDNKRTNEAKQEYEENVSFLCAVADDPLNRSYRSTICYALNSKRSSNAELLCRIQFEGLCRLFRAILSGCDRETGGVSNAKMCMMLAQTFYMVGQDDKVAAASPDGVCRSKRIFVKTRISDHPLWMDEEFWDQALFQCVSESLTHSGVMAGFDTKKGASSANRSEWTEMKKFKWHDLSQKERSQAASQVHAVVFAQLGALAHSMMEFGCGLERSCAFVRRMSIRNQLPISQRTMLLQHLTRRPEMEANGTQVTS